MSGIDQVDFPSPKLDKGNHLLKTVDWTRSWMTWKAWSSTQEDRVLIALDYGIKWCKQPHATSAGFVARNNITETIIVMTTQHLNNTLLTAKTVVAGDDGQPPSCLNSCCGRRFYHADYLCRRKWIIHVATTWYFWVWFTMDHCRRHPTGLQLLGPPWPFVSLWMFGYEYFS